MNLGMMNTSGLCWISSVGYWTFPDSHWVSACSKYPRSFQANTNRSLVFCSSSFGEHKSERNSKWNRNSKGSSFGVSSSSSVEEPWRFSVESNEFVFFATCLHGLGEYLGLELDPKYNRAGSVKFNTRVLQVLPSGVYFACNSLAGGYQAVLWSRCATRVLIELGVAQLSPRKPYLEEIYNVVRECGDWNWLLNGGQLKFNVNVRTSNDFYNQNAVRIRVKDAICDAIRDTNGSKPSKPDQDESADVPLFVTLSRGEFRIYRDLAGESLHKRGYRTDTIHVSSLNETLAAGMLYMAGSTPTALFSEQKVIVDPMCGSGTLLIEAALLCLQVAPGLFRERFVFESWPDFNANAFDEIIADANESAQDETEYLFIGNDVHSGALELARKNSQFAGLHRVKCMQWYNEDIRDGHRFINASSTPSDSQIITITNPPWGIRLTNDIESAWKDLGQYLRQYAPCTDAYILSGQKNSSSNLRLKAERKYPVRVGNVDARVLKYHINEYRPQ